MTEESEFEEMSNYDEQETADAPSTVAKVAGKVRRHKHVILYGPPGTGKTRIISAIVDHPELEVGHTDLVQFHQQYSYQDFIEGFTVREGQFSYKPGVFLNFVDRMHELDGELNHILFIDEINRADISSVFGELLTLLYNPVGQTVRLPASERELKIEQRFSIVGTMNSADKNIAILDFALRRRFDFVFIPPDYEGMTSWLNSFGLDFDEFSIPQYVRFAKELNKRITAHPLLWKNMTLGQALFVPNSEGNAPLQLSEVCEMIADKVIPQIEAYVGIGNYSDMAKILSPDVRHKAEKGLAVTDEDIVNLIRSIAPEEAS